MSFSIDIVRPRRPPAWAVMTFLIIIFTAGCSVTRDVAAARKAVDSARAFHADYLAPYEFTSAEIYLDEARNQLRRSDFSRASRYARKASAMASAACETAMKNAHGPGATSLYRPPPSAGASDDPAETP